MVAAKLEVLFVRVILDDMKLVVHVRAVLVLAAMDVP